MRWVQASGGLGHNQTRTDGIASEPSKAVCAIPAFDVSTCSILSPFTLPLRADDFARRTLWTRVAALLLLWSPLWVFAQGTSGSPSQQASQAEAAEPEILSSYEGQNVSIVEIAGQPDHDVSDFKSDLAQQQGQPFSKDKVKQTAAALKATGKFTDVRVQIQPEATGVRVQFVLEPALYFGIYQFPGAERFAYSRLIQIANYPTQTPFDRTDLNRGRNRLVTFFQQEGYFEAQVDPDVQVDAAHSLANVAFRVKLGRKAKFGAVVIDGVKGDDSASLPNKLATLMARARGAAIRPGKAYHHSTMNHAQQYLQGLLAKEGYLGAQVKLSGAEYHADTNRADIHLCFAEYLLFYPDFPQIGSRKERFAWLKTRRPFGAGGWARMA